MFTPTSAIDCGGTCWNLILVAFQCADQNPVGLHDDCSAAIVATLGAPAVRCHDINGLHGAQRECVHPPASDAWAWKEFARASYLKDMFHRSPVHQVRGKRAAASTLVRVVMKFYETFQNGALASLNIFPLHIHHRVHDAIL